MQEAAKAEVDAAYLRATQQVEEIRHHLQVRDEAIALVKKQVRLPDATLGLCPARWSLCPNHHWDWLVGRRVAKHWLMVGPIDNLGNAWLHILGKSVQGVPSLEKASEAWAHNESNSGSDGIKGGVFQIQVLAWYNIHKARFSKRCVWGGGGSRSKEANGLVLTPALACRRPHLSGCGALQRGARLGLAQELPARKGRERTSWRWHRGRRRHWRTCSWRQSGRRMSCSRRWMPRGGQQTTLVGSPAGQVQHASKRWPVGVERCAFPP